MIQQGQVFKLTAKGTDGERCERDGRSLAPVARTGAPMPLFERRAERAARLIDVAGDRDSDTHPRSTLAHELGRADRRGEASRSRER